MFKTFSLNLVLKKGQIDLSALLFFLLLYKNTTLSFLCIKYIYTIVLLYKTNEKDVRIIT